MRLGNRLIVSALALALLALLAPPAVLAEDGVFYVVINKSRPETMLPLKDLVRIYRGDLRFFSDKTPIVPIQPTDATVNRAFVTSVLKLNPPDYSRLWKEKVFRGDAAKEPLMLGKNEAVLRYVANSLRAIAIIEGPISVDGMNVRVLTVDGKAPGAPGYPVTRK